MSKSRIHPADCACPQCAPRHPAVHRLAPSLRASLIALAFIAMWTAVFALAGLLARVLDGTFGIGA